VFRSFRMIRGLMSGALGTGHWLKLERCTAAGEEFVWLWLG
jgi:hypothetical protein